MSEVLDKYADAPSLIIGGLKLQDFDKLDSIIYEYSNNVSDGKKRLLDNMILQCINDDKDLYVACLLAYMYFDLEEDHHKDVLRLIYDKYPTSLVDKFIIRDSDLLEEYIVELISFVAVEVIKDHNSLKVHLNNDGTSMSQCIEIVLTENYIMREDPIITDELETYIINLTDLRERAEASVNAGKINES